MKLSKKHTLSFSNCFGILLGIILLSVISLDSKVDETDSSFLDSIPIESVSLNNGSAPAEKDSTPAEMMFELVFKQAAEIENPSLEIKGFTLLEERVKISDAGLVKFFLDSPGLLEKIRLLSKKCILCIKNTSVHLIFHPILRHSGSIAIHAP